MTKQEEVRKKVIEAVPDIVSGKYGCEAIQENTGEVFFFSDGHFWISRRNSNVRILAINFKGEILGRPIRLADFLSAVASNDIRRICCDELGNILEYSSKGKIIAEYGNWNLRADSLDSQSEETIDFLYQLLCK